MNAPLSEANAADPAVREAAARLNDSVMDALKVGLTVTAEVIEHRHLFFGQIPVVQVHTRAKPNDLDPHA